MQASSALSLVAREGFEGRLSAAKEAQEKAKAAAAAAEARADKAEQGRMAAEAAAAMADRLRQETEAEAQVGTVYCNLHCPGSNYSNVCLHRAAGVSWTTRLCALQQRTP